MAMSILGKLHLIGASNAHGLLDKVIDLNSVGAVEQYQRELQQARDEMLAAQDQIDGQIATANQRHSFLAGQILTLQTRAEHLIANGEQFEAGARAALAKAQPYKTEDAALSEQLEQLATRKSQVEQAVNALNGKLQAMSAQLSTLRATVRLSDAETKASQAAHHASALLDDSSVDSVTRRAQERAGVASAAFDREMGGLQGDPNDQILANAELDEEFAKLKAKVTG